MHTKAPFDMNASSGGWPALPLLSIYDADFRAAFPRVAASAARSPIPARSAGGASGRGQERCSVREWCTQTGAHKGHLGEEIGLTIPGVTTREVTAQLCDEDDPEHGPGVHPVGVAVGADAAELTAVQLRGLVAQILEFLPQLLALADQVDLANGVPLEGR